MSFTINGHIIHSNSRHEARHCCTNNSSCNKSFTNTETNSRTVCTKMHPKYANITTNCLYNRWKMPVFSLHQLFVIVLFGILTFLSDTVCAFNLDTRSPEKFTGPRGSYFGYSVLLHENFQGKWILAGAPRDRSIYQPQLESPGALYKCRYPQLSRSSCTQVKVDDKGNEMSAPSERPYVLDAKDNQWLGVSLARQNIGRNGKVTVCGHLWANDFYKDAILPNGVCYTAGSSLGFNTVTKQRPCVSEVQIKADKAGRGIAWHGWCQAGFSAKYTDDGSTLILGAVGSLAWRGSIVSITGGASRVSDVTSWFPPEEEDESYIGYAVTSGHFLDTIQTEGVTGAPRAYEKGKVYIYDLTDFTLLSQLNGESMNTYFGAAVLAIDLNHDGLSDLLVGAPLFSEVQDEGRVYIFMNEGRAVMRRNDVSMSGSNQPSARFGSCIELAGDLNKDSFMDVVIGAPFEDEQSGAVYIYHGSQSGLRTQHVQRLAGKSIDPLLKSFGSSISALIDVDNNNYTDLLIGAYESDSAILYRSKPIVNIKAFMAISRSPIDLNRTDCTLEFKKVPCVRAMVCFMYTDTEPSTIAIDFTLDTEYYKMQANLPPRMQFVEKGQFLGTKYTQSTVLQSKLQACFEIQAHIKKDLKDYLSPVPFRLNYALRTRENTRVPPVTICGGLSQLCPVLNYYSPNDIVEQVRFIHNCGDDSVCETDLQLRARVALPRGTPYLPLGTEEAIYVFVDLFNQGEEAHMTQVKITYPEEVAFVRVENIGNQETLVLCFPIDIVNRTAAIICDVDNPMRAHSRSRFRVRLSVEGVGRRSPNLDVQVQAATSSLEHNSTLADNFVFISLPVRIEADVTISGVTHPEQVFYGASRKLEKDSSLKGIEKGMDGNMLPTMSPRDKEKTREEILDEKVGPKFRHIYDARNLGPSDIPSQVLVNISLPWKTHDDQWLLYFTHILFQGTGRCDYYHIIREQHEELGSYLSNRSSITTPSKEHSRVSSLFESKPKTLTCGVMKCVTISCYVDNLAVGEGAVIEIHARLFEKTFMDNEFGIVAVVSEAKISVHDPFQEHIQPRDNRPDLIKVSTLAYTDKGTNNWRVPRWAIILSIAIGIVVLIGLVGLMWKCGFFKRQMREEMERLIQEKDENETLYPEGIWDRPYDDPPEEHLIEK